ncbi:hypothetical protein KM043_000326 [Ampulex compressa]|nr:hypothetical protein KM043_000326 [Ampulex compressa]
MAGAAHPVEALRVFPSKGHSHLPVGKHRAASTRSPALIGNRGNSVPHKADISEWAQESVGGEEKGVREWSAVDRPWRSSRRARARLAERLSYPATISGSRSGLYLEKLVVLGVPLAAILAWRSTGQHPDGKVSCFWRLGSWTGVAEEAHPHTYYLAELLIPPPAPSRPTQTLTVAASL